MRRFYGQPVTIRIEPGRPFKLYVESAGGDTAEFTVGRASVTALK